MSELKLSEKEQKLFDFIKEKEYTTIEMIKTQLGESYIGGIGKLIQKEVIYSEKRKLDVDTTFNKYGFKMTKVYIAGKKEEV